MNNFKTLIRKSDYLSSIPHEEKPLKTKWNSLKSLRKFCLKSPITSIEFSAQEMDSPDPSRNLVVTSELNISLYNSSTFQPSQRFSRFKTKILHGTVRKDGKMIAGSSEGGRINLYDSSTKDILRIFRDHKGAVPCVIFDANSLTEIGSFGEDGTIRLWDIPNNTQLTTIKAHSSITCAKQVVNRTSHWLTGGDDNSVNLWDCQSKSSQMTITTPAPVSKLETGGEYIFCSWEKTLAMYDLRKTNKAIKEWNHHHKPITSLSYKSADKCILSSSLDKSIKAHDVNSFELVYQKHFTEEITSVAVNKTGSKVAVGDIKGDVIFLADKSALKLESENKEGRYLKLGANKDGNKMRNMNERYGGMEVTVAHPPKRMKMAPYDHLLRKFRYKKALDSVMKGDSTVDLGAALLKELLERGALEIAIEGRDDETLSPLLKFLERHLLNIKYLEIFASVIWTILEMYQETIFHWQTSKYLIKRIIQKIEWEESLQKNLCEFKGVLQTVKDSTEITAILMQ